MSAFSVIINDIKTDIKEVGSWIKGVDWAQEVAYWQEFVKGLETVVVSRYYLNDQGSGHSCPGQCQ